MTDGTEAFGERMKAAVEAKQGMALNADELKMVFDALRTEMENNRILNAREGAIADALKWMGYKVLCGKDGMVYGIEIIPKENEETVN